MSVLERMYTYAKSVGAGARENFTTEALAGAIRADASVFVAFLQRAGQLPVGDAFEVDLETQVVIPGTGTLDMVFVCVVNAIRHEIWIEVKVMAGESGRQLDNYRDHLAQIPAPIRPRLVVLARRPLRARSDVAFASWHDLRRQAEQSSQPAWRDMADYLTEIRMSNTYDEPISPREATALTDFRLMHGKVARIIFDAANEAAARWPLLPWPTDEAAIRGKTLERLGTHEQLLVGVPAANSRHGIWLTFGVDLRSDEPRLHSAVETWPSAIDLQRVVHQRADLASMPKEWQRSLGAWGGLKRTTPLSGVSDPQLAVEWFVTRFDELGRAGVLELVAAGRAILSG